MGIFDIIGPVMVGPSSSHTAGAARIGFVARNLLGEDVKEARILLYGSFLATGKGHGTDKAFAIIPVLFMGLYPGFSTLNIMGLHSPQSTVLSAIIYNALIIITLIPLALKGVKYREIPAGKLLSRNLLVYGLGGLIAPFIFVKLIDMLLVLFGLA